jgi:FtsH-binding integral membrane protein
MNWFDRLTLLATGLTAIYLVVRFMQDYRGKDPKPTHNMYYIISFAVLLVAGLLLIAFGWGALANPLVAVVATLIPLGLSMGLVAEFHQKYAKGYLIFCLIGLIVILITRFTQTGGFAVFVYAFVHSIAGLLVFLLPILAVKTKKAPSGFIMVAVGGVLIGVGGIALAFLKAGAPILSAETILAILAPLLLLMTLAYTWGFVKKIKAE